MKIHHFAVFVLLFGLVAGSASGAIYESVDGQGNVTFSDEPGADATPVKLPSLPTYTAPSYAPASDASDQRDQEQQEQSPYRSLAIIQPQQDETLRDSPGAVLVTAASDPGLRSSDRFQFYLDGESVAEPISTAQATLGDVPRGTHQVAVAIVDSSGKEVMRSSSVTFFLHRQNVRPKQPRN